MSKTSAPDSDAVEPPFRHTAPWRLTGVVALPESRLRVTFVDGTSGEVDLCAFLAHPDVTGTTFEVLRDPAHFAAAAVVLGAVCWPNGADLAPDAMYDDAIRAHGCWTPD